MMDREVSISSELLSPSSQKLNLRPPGVRQFQKKVEQVKTLLRTVEEKDKASAALRMQRDDFAASLKNQQNLGVKLEAGLLQRDSELKHKQALLDDMQVRYDELHGVLENERDVADQLRVKVQRLEDKLVNERMQGSSLMEEIPRLQSDVGDNLAEALRTAGADDCEECEYLREQLADMKNHMLERAGTMQYKELETRLNQALECKRVACDIARELLRLCDSAVFGTFGPDEQRQFALLRRQLHENGNNVSGVDDGQEEPRERLNGVCSLREPEEELAPPPATDLAAFRAQMKDRKELASTVLKELSQELSQLNLQLAKASENEEQQLRDERSQLQFQLASSRKLEFEQERIAEHL